MTPCRTAVNHRRLTETSCATTAMEILDETCDYQFRKTWSIEIPG